MSFITLTSKGFGQGLYATFYSHTKLLKQNQKPFISNLCGVTRLGFVELLTKKMTVLLNWYKPVFLSLTEPHKLGMIYISF